jgi:hypothetical protein
MISSLTIYWYRDVLNKNTAPEYNLHLVFAAFLNEKKLVNRLYHVFKIQL